MATNKAALDLAAKNARMDDRTEIYNHMEVLFPGWIRSPEIYSKVMWFTCEVSTYIIFTFTDHIIMGNACIC